MSYIWPPTQRLEQVAREIAAEWHLPLGERFPMSRFAYAAPLGDHVLKITPPEDDQADHELDALLEWNGNGAVRVLRYDRSRRAMLLDRIHPGYDASTVDESEAIAALLAVGSRVWRPVRGGPFHTVTEATVADIERCRGSHSLVTTAEETFARIVPGETVLLHGDLHHHNLLRGPGGWVAVDPKPLVGDREYDVAAFLWNPLGSHPTPERTDARMEAFASAGLDPARLRAWAIVRGILWDLPVDPGEEETSRPLAVVRHLLDKATA